MQVGNAMARSSARALFFSVAARCASHIRSANSSARPWRVREGTCRSSGTVS